MAQGIHTTVGLFSDIERAAAAVDELESRGYGSQVSAIAYESDQVRELNTRTDEETPDVAERTAKGAGAGAVVGGLAGLLAAAAIPGIGLIAAGPLAAAVGGAAAGAAVGGAVGALTGIGMDESDAAAYDERLRGGDILIAVSTTNETDIAAEGVLRDFGGESVHTLHNVDVSDTREGTAA